MCLDLQGLLPPLVPPGPHQTADVGILQALQSLPVVLHHLHADAGHQGTLAVVLHGLLQQALLGLTLGGMKRWGWGWRNGVWGVVFQNWMVRCIGNLYSLPKLNSTVYRNVCTHYPKKLSVFSVVTRWFVSWYTRTDWNLLTSLKIWNLFSFFSSKNTMKDFINLNIIPDKDFYDKDHHSIWYLA